MSDHVFLIYDLLIWDLIKYDLLCFWNKCLRLRLLLIPVPFPCLHTVQRCSEPLTQVSSVDNLYSSKMASSSFWWLLVIAGIERYQFNPCLYLHRMPCQGAHLSVSFIIGNLSVALGPVWSIMTLHAHILYFQMRLPSGIQGSWEDACHLNVCILNFPSQQAPS